MSNKFGEIIKKLQPLWKWAKPNHMQALVGFPRGDPESAEFTRHGDPPFWAATWRGEGEVICGLI